MFAFMELYEASAKKDIMFSVMKTQWAAIFGVWKKTR